MSTRDAAAAVSLLEALLEDRETTFNDICAENTAGDLMAGMIELAASLLLTASCALGVPQSEMYGLLMLMLLEAEQ